MSKRSVVTGVTEELAWQWGDNAWGTKTNKVYRVDYVRNGRKDWMDVFGEDELGAYQAAQKRLDAMDRKEDEGNRHAKRRKG